MQRIRKVGRTRTARVPKCSIALRRGKAFQELLCASQAVSKRGGRPEREDKNDRNIYLTPARDTNMRAFVLTLRGIDAFSARRLGERATRASLGSCDNYNAEVQAKTCDTAPALESRKTRWMDFSGPALRRAAAGALANRLPLERVSPAFDESEGGQESERGARPPPRASSGHPPDSG